VSAVTSRTLRRRLWHKWRRFTIDRYGRRDFALAGGAPYISFTFDDFPLSAYERGGGILASHGARGTYFVSLQMLGQPSASGPIASRTDLERLVADGHEVGCHTFEHLDGCRSSVEAFERSIAANRAALADCLPGETFRTFAYPLDGPVLGIKRAVGRHFLGCRWGGQTFNAGVIDLNLLRAYFLDGRNRDDLDAVRMTIERNAAAGGWLIFATHDVAERPSQYGCDARYFNEVVRLAAASGARILPMGAACRELRIGG